MVEKYVPVEEQTNTTDSSWPMPVKTKENGFHKPGNQLN